MNNSQKPVILIGYGNDTETPLISDLPDLGYDSRLDSLFTATLSYRFPQRPELFAVFTVSSHWEFLVILTLGLLLSSMTKIIVGYVREKDAKFEADRIALIEQTIDMLLDQANDDIDQEKSLELKNKWPSLVEKMNQLKKRMESSLVDKSIARTTQMLAHDVRKPFSLMTSLIELVSASNDPEETQKILNESLDTISRSLVSVEAMIQDVMDVGSNAKIQRKPVEIDRLLQQTLETLLQFKKHSEITFRYSYHHEYQIDVDPLKMERVFTNIIANAIEHMPKKGHIWFETNSNKHSTVITIGNSSTFIPKEDLNKLFEAFYTKNKTGGTGLGLAIVKKIIDAHDGKIWCESDPSKGTEFHIEIHSARNLSQVIERSNQKADDFYAKTNKNILENNLSPTKTKLSRVLHFEDENVYIRRWRKYYPKELLLSFSSWSEFEESAAFREELKSFDFVITDFYLKDETGVDIAKKLRSLSYKMPIFLNSNVTELSDEEERLFTKLLSKDPKLAKEEIDVFFKSRHN